MLVIANKAFIFHEEKFEEVDGKKVNKADSKPVVIHPNEQVQELPDWVADTELYKMAEEDGSIMQVKSKKAKSGLSSAVNNDPKPQEVGFETAKVVGENNDDNKQANTTGGWGASK